MDDKQIPRTRYDDGVPHGGKMMHSERIISPLGPLKPREEAI